ncbi:MAG TPA: OmpA family protein [Myxococcaceae bacterium]|nr:OmpA family protein [Myxococcaceae bacterium]
MSQSSFVGRASVIALALTSFTVLAQEPSRSVSFELERLDLNPAATGSLVLGTGELMPAGDFRLSAVGHYQHDPFVFSRGGEVRSIVGSRATLHLAAAYAPFSWLELGAQVPVVAFQQGADLSDEGFNQPASSGLSTPIFNARFGLLSQLRGSWSDLALELGVGPPIGGKSGFTRDNGLRYAPRLMMGRRFGWFRVALDTRLMRRPPIAAYSDQELTRDAIDSEVHLGLALATVGHRLRWELDVRGVVPLKQQQGSAELLVGPRFLVNPSSEVFALAAVGGGSAPGTPLFRVLVGAAFGRVIPPRLEGESAVNCSPELDHTPEECPELDEDEDSVPNGLDACVDEPGTLDRLGCPLKDTDGDGIEDKLDACPSERGLGSWQGCPMPDQDKDGIEDERDVCPSEPGPELSRGCPLKDRDQDGVEDDVDQCPDLAGPVERQGCPESDLDKDSIPNITDTCAKEAGTADNRGCPAHEAPLVSLTRKQIELSTKIYFQPGLGRIDERSYSVLNWVAKVIIEHPELTLVVVGAHTDDRGTPLDNLRTSQARADAVVQYLITKGVEAGRLEAKGYGQDRPIDSNATSIGRENNRRIEFVIVTSQ